MRDPDTIEREIATERDALVHSLRELDERLSPEALVKRATDSLRGPAASATDAARDNPLALALIGSGVAWLFANTNSRIATDGGRHQARTGHATYDRRVQPTAPGLNATQPTGNFDARLAAADAAMRQQDRKGDDTMSMSQTGHYPNDPRFEPAPQGKRDRMRQSARDLRDRLHDGLDSLPDGAKARILETRLKAIEAQSAIEARVARGSDSVQRGARDNPLLIGAIAFGLGAAVAAALPRTSAENRTLGARRDQFLDDAERMIREETAKLRTVAEAAVEEGKEAVKDTLRTGPPSEDDPVERVHSAAKREAEKQGVGNVN